MSEIPYLPTNQRFYDGKLRPAEQNNSRLSVFHQRFEILSWSGSFKRGEDEILRTYAQYQHLKDEEINMKRDTAMENFGDGTVTIDSAMGKMDLHGGSAAATSSVRIHEWLGRTPYQVLV